MRDLLLLDLYCGEGGAGAGYAQAGFTVIGVDNNDDWSGRRSRRRPRPLDRYPFAAFEGDALEVLRTLLVGGSIDLPNGLRLRLEDFAAIHASPPCQLHSQITRVFDRRGDGFDHPELIRPTRRLLQRTGLPYVIENVEGAPLRNPTMLCGSMFDPPLDVRRHRLFECNWRLRRPQACRHRLWTPRFRSADYRGRKSGSLMSVVPVYGGTRYVGDVELRRRVMGMPWASNQGCVEAIPPTYTQWIGSELRAHLSGRPAA